ncbi:MAG: hypothetical protein M1829_003420 [Trizodia sp. TS-e1964]|nr:MAG: hypothetical protein M1829_003420 [Trizodia sp. TS-e1964]
MDRMDTGSTSGHDSPSGLADRAQQACSSCRKQKRRCDKALPACGLCLRMGRACDYYDSSVPPTSDDFHFLRQRVLHLELKLEGRAGSSVASPDLARGPFASRSTPARDAAMGMLVGGGSPRAAPDFPSIFFLDGNAFKHKNITISKNHMPPPPEVAEALGSTADMQLVVDTYFTTIHSWLPIISKKRLPRHLQNPLADPGADLALLFLCMKLLAEPSSEHPESPKTPLYHMAKRFYFLVELHGINSLQLIQAAILLALYEVGNAIYPAAYLSVGHCVQLGYALGLHDRKSVQMLKKAGTWTETEERRRVWWAIIVLDRCVVSRHQSAITSPSPSPSPSPLAKNHKLILERTDM